MEFIDQHMYLNKYSYWDETLVSTILLNVLLRNPSYITVRNAQQVEKLIFHQKIVTMRRQQYQD